MHMALFRVRDGFISAQVSEIFHQPLGEWKIGDECWDNPSRMRNNAICIFSHDFRCFVHFLNVFIISFFTRVRDGFISDLVSKWGVCLGVRESSKMMIWVWNTSLYHYYCMIQVCYIWLYNNYSIILFCYICLHQLDGMISVYRWLQLDPV